MTAAPEDFRRLDDLPEVLTPRDLIAYLPVGRDAIYQLLRSQTIRNVRVGQKIIIPRAAVGEFLAGATE